MPIGIHHAVRGENPVGQDKLFPLAHGISFPAVAARYPGDFTR